MPPEFIPGAFFDSRVIFPDINPWFLEQITI